MSSRIVKLACAAALAMPLVGAAGVTSAHAADDCNHPYGAIQGGSSDEATCDRVGLHLRERRDHHHNGNGNGNGNNGPSGQIYTLTGTVPTTADTLLTCDLGPNGTDELIAAQATHAGTTTGYSLETIDNAGFLLREGTTPIGLRLPAGGVGPFQAGDTVQITCIDNKPPRHHTNIAA